MTIPVGPPSKEDAASASAPSASAPVSPATVAPTPAVPRRAQAVIALLTVLVATLAAMLIGEPGTSGSAGAATGGQTGAQSGSGDGASTPVTPTGETTEVTVRVDGMAYTPDVIEVPAGDALVITFVNTGDQRHDLVLATGARTPQIAPGETAVLEAGVVNASMDGWCSLPGHRAMGMELAVVVAGAALADPGPGTAPDHDMSGMDHGSGVTELEAPSMAELAAHARTRDALPAELAPLGDETHHEYTFEVTETTEAIAEGVTKALWTFNGTSPGPTLHGRVGDTFEITLVNNGTMGHSIDFHAGELAPDVPMRTIEPGESLVYEFTAHRSGVWMYHCATMPMTQHIANGMFGAVVIEPDDLEPVDREYVLIQSEIYLGEQAGPASATKSAAMEPDAMAFNGRPFQYQAHPLQAQAGERVRFWVLDAGPSMDLSFHVVGAQFDTVWTEGAYSVHRGLATDGLTQGTTGAQVLPLLAAQGGFVELVAPEPGRYPFVNHQMALAEKGAQGVLEVTERP